MNDDSFLALSLTQSLAEKAIESINSGGKREIRNALELFHTFFNQLNVEYVPFSRGKYISSFGSSFESYIKRLVSNVRKSCLKSLIVGLIYQVFLKGNELNKKYGPFLWIHSLLKVDNEEILSYNERGIFAFYVNLNKFNLEDLALLIKENNKSIFLIQVDDDCKTLLNMPQELDNASFMLSEVAFKRFSRELHRARAFFGVIKPGDGCNEELERNLITNIYNDGGAFIAYYNIDNRIDCAIYNDLYRSRKLIKENMAFCNLNGLIKNIQRKLMEERK